MPETENLKVDLVIGVFLLLLFASIGYFIAINSGFFAKPTEMEIKVDVESKACEGDMTIFAELRNSEGRRVPDALIHIYAPEGLLDSLYTDRNGQIRFEVDVPSGWCGGMNYISARYDGDGLHLPTRAEQSVTVKSQVPLFINVTDESIVGEELIVNVYSTRILNLRNKEIELGSMSAMANDDGIATFVLTPNESGTLDLVAEFEGDAMHEPSQAEAAVEILPRSCEDGTIVGQCSGHYICTEEQKLEFSCEECGCAQGRLCIENQCMTEEERIEMLIEELQESSLLIESDAGTGSGVVISNGDNKTTILTNRHVVDPEFALIAARNLEIFNYDREIGKPARIYLAPNQIDMAIIEVNKYMGPPTTINFSAEIKRGSEVLAMGSPLGVQNTVTKGIVSNFYDDETEGGYEYEAIQMDAAVNPGNSGGGVFLASTGELIGITTFKLVLARGELAEGLGFAVPVTLLEEFSLDEWRTIPPS